MLLGADGKVRHRAASRGGAATRKALPAESAETGVRLRCCSPAQKNGEKRLRSLLVRTSEWKNEAQRASVVRAARGCALGTAKPATCPRRPPLALA